MMKLVRNKALLSTIFKDYSKSKCFFPLMGAVLEGKQDGWVYVDDIQSPQVILAIHKFMFAQIICDTPFDRVWENICRVLEQPKNNFHKVRFYCANDSFINYLERTGKFKLQKGERVRFGFKDKIKTDSITPGDLFSEDINQLNERLSLDVDNRFWSGINDFINNSLAYCFKEDQTIKSVCYGAAVSGKRAEIDIATHPEYRKKGYAKKSAVGFINNCYRNGITPLWDCYLNNIASVNTAISLGFSELFRYNFLIIYKN